MYERFCRAASTDGDWRASIGVEMAEPSKGSRAINDLYCILAADLMCSVYLTVIVLYGDLELFEFFD